MSYDVAAPLERTAVNGCCECVVDDERYAVIVSELGELLNIENINSRISDSLTEYALCVGLEVLGEFIIRQ